MTYAADAYAFAFEADLSLGEDLLRRVPGLPPDAALLTRSPLGTFWTDAPDHTVPEGFDELRLAVAPGTDRVIGASAVVYLDTPEAAEARARANAWSLTMLHGPTQPRGPAACVRWVRDLEDGRRLQLSCYRNARIVALRLCLGVGRVGVVRLGCEAAFRKWQSAQTKSPSTH